MATVELRYSPQNNAWFTANATMILKAGEPAYHATTGLFKLGDGTTQLSALPFLPATGGGGGGNFVPYIGATGDVDLGEYELKAGQIELDQTPTGTAGVAVTRWNDTNGLTETTLKGGNVVIKNGIDLVARVVNKVTPNATLTKAQYQVVKISGAQGQRLAVGLAQGNNDNNSADTLGVAIETITTNQEGFIMCVGVIENINTTGSLQGETWADGDVLYLSPTTAGAITKVKPNGSTGHIVVIGYVEYAHANNGKIYVKVMNGWELDELHNVYINAPADNEVLTYESATSLWKNKAISTGLTTGITTIASGTNTKILYNNSGVLGEYSTTGTGTTSVLSTSPTFVTDIRTPNVTGISGNLTLTNTVQSIGAITQFTFINVANTNQTASTNIPNFRVNGSNKQWATGSLTNQYWNYLTANTASFVGASTITNSYGLFVETTIADTNATITNNYAAGFSGRVSQEGLGGSTFFGSRCGIKDDLTSNLNTGFGADALLTNISGINNCAFGYSALRVSTVSNNTAIGYQSQFSTTTGDQNTSIGSNAMYSNQTGGGNTAIGALCLLQSTGNYNTAIGNYSAYNVTSGVLNTIIGYDTGGGITTGSRNTVIGSGVTGLTSTLSNNVIIADGAGNKVLWFNSANALISDLKIDTTTGIKIGTATTQKLSFWNATPIVQPTTAVAAATLISNAGTALTSTDTFDGYTLQQIVKALRNTGLLA